MILNDPGGWCNWFPIIIIEGQRLAVDENVDVKWDIVFKNVPSKFFGYSV